MSKMDDMHFIHWDHHVKSQGGRWHVQRQRRPLNPTPLAPTTILTLRSLRLSIHVLIRSLAAEKKCKKGGQVRWFRLLELKAQSQQWFKPSIDSFCHLWRRCNLALARQPNCCESTQFQRKFRLKSPCAKRQPKQLCLWILLLHSSIDPRIRLEEKEKIDAVAIAYWCQSKKYTYSTSDLPENRHRSCSTIYAGIQSPAETTAMWLRTLKAQKTKKYCKCLPGVSSLAIWFGFTNFTRRQPKSLALGETAWVSWSLGCDRYLAITFARLKCDMGEEYGKGYN